MAIDGRLPGETTEERSISELLRDALRDYRQEQDCPDEDQLERTWPALCEHLREAAKLSIRRDPAPAPVIDLKSFVFPEPLVSAPPMSISSPCNEAAKMDMPQGKPEIAAPSCKIPVVPPPQPWVPSWRRLLAAA